MKMTIAIGISVVMAMPAVQVSAAAPTPRPKQAKSFSDEDLEHYKKMRPKTQSTPLPDPNQPTQVDTPSEPGQRPPVVTTTTRRPAARKLRYVRRYAHAEDPNATRVDESKQSRDE